MITARIKLEYVHECPPISGVPCLETIAAWVDPQTGLLDWDDDGVRWDWSGRTAGHCERCEESLPNYALESDMHRVKELQL